MNLAPVAWALVGVVLLAAVPLAVASLQFLLVARHARHDHLDRSAPVLPRTAVLVPAHNEAAVLDVSLDRLLSLDYPPDRLRVVLVDDASTDRTPEVVAGVQRRHPGRLVYLRRAHGGQGKSAVLEHGIEALLSDEWMEALLITDADVIFERASLRRMTRHLADPEVGAVGAFVREGGIPGSAVSKMVAYEYVGAQAVARRAGNVVGAQACIPGGAQLHTRHNLERFAGRIEASSLAEDTVTTLRTQLDGRRVVFDGDAVCWAEEPRGVTALWNQRLRWARGNLQVTREFKGVWFHRRHGIPGSTFFGIVWFSVVLQPALMILASVALILLFVLTRGLADPALRALWIVNALTFTFTTVVTLLADPVTSRRVWPQAVLFPGVVALLIIVGSVVPHPFAMAVRDVMGTVGWVLTPGWRHAAVLFACAWVGGCMAVASLARLVERRRGTRWLMAPLVYVAGYGPLLCAVGVHAYLCELRGTSATWQVTPKTGRALAHEA